MLRKQATDSSAWNLAKSDPHALVQAAIENELNNSYGHRAPVRYLLRKKTRNLDTTKEYCRNQSRRSGSPGRHP